MEIIYLDVIAIAQHIDMHDDLVSNDDNIYRTYLIVVAFLLKRYCAEEQSSRFLKIMKFCTEKVITIEVVNDMDNDMYEGSSQM